MLIDSTKKCHSIEIDYNDSNYDYLTINLRVNKPGLSLPKVNEIPVAIAKMIEIVLEKSTELGFDKNCTKEADYIKNLITRTAPVTDPHYQYNEYESLLDTAATTYPNGLSPLQYMKDHMAEAHIEILFNGIREYSQGYTTDNYDHPSSTPIDIKDLKTQIPEICAYIIRKMGQTHFLMSEEQVRIVVALMIDNDMLK